MVSAPPTSLYRVAAGTLIALMIGAASSSFAQSSHFVPSGAAFERDVNHFQNYRAEMPPPDPFQEMVQGYTPPGFYEALPGGRDLDKNEVRQTAEALVAHESRLRSYHAEVNLWRLPVGPDLRHPDYTETYPETTTPVPSMSGETAWTFGGRWSAKGIKFLLNRSRSAELIHYVADGEGWLRTRVTRFGPEGTPSTSGLIRMLQPSDRGHQPFPDSALGRDLMRAWSPLTLLQVVAASHSTLHGRKLDDGSVVLRGSLTVDDLPGAFGIMIRTQPDLEHAPTEIIVYDGRFAMPLSVSLFADYETRGTAPETINLPSRIATTGLIPNLERELIEALAHDASTIHGIDVSQAARETTLANPIWAKLAREALEEADARSLHGPFGWSYAVINYRSVNQPLPPDAMSIELPENATIGDQRDSTMRRWDGERLIPNAPPPAD